MSHIDDRARDRGRGDHARDLDPGAGLRAHLDVRDEVRR